MAHALSRPFLPATPRRAVDSYWRYHPVRADKLARALAALSGGPDGWVWRVEIEKSGPLASFRVPPTPFREPPYTKGPGHCCVCGQPIFRFGWHRDLWGDQRPNQNTTWHSCCIAAWNLWTAPSDHVRHLKILQKRRCLATGERLLKRAEVGSAAHDALGRINAGLNPTICGVKAICRVGPLASLQSMAHGAICQRLSESA
jgi:hypothetical protein